MTLEWTSTGSRLVYEEMEATLTFKDNDVRAVYVDWDDGDSNKKTESNYQWVQFTEPKKSAVVKHTYAKAGSFKPVIQTINSQGIASKYMSNEATNTDVTPHVYASGGAMENLTILDRNPTAVMRVENKTVKSGIDNSIFEKEGALNIYANVAPLISQTDLNGLVVDLELKMLVEQDMVYASGAAHGSLSTIVQSPQVGVETVVITDNWEIDLTDGAGMFALSTFESRFYKVRKLLKATFKRCKYVEGENIGDYTKEDNFNKVKLFINALASDGYYYPLTYITPGTPIKEINDRRRYITMDFSQSRASASNASIDYYKYDSGKSWFNPYKKWASVISGTSLTFDSTTSSSTAVQDVHYTYTPRPDGLMGNGLTAGVGTEYMQAFASGTNFKWYTATGQDPREDQFAIDDFNRFYDQYHLIRDTADVSSPSVKYSGLPYFEGGVYRICPAEKWTSGSQAAIGSTPTTISITKLYQTSSYAALAGGASPPKGTIKVTSGSYTNSTSVSGGLVYMREWNGITFKDRLASTRHASEYFIMASATKHNKVFFNCSPYAKDLQSDLSTFTNGTQIAGVYYLKVNNSGGYNQTVEWVPVEFEDTTKVTKEYRNTSDYLYQEKSESLAKSGYITFDMPSDWGSISISGMIGNASLGVAESDTPTDPSSVTNPYQIDLVNWTCTATGALNSSAGVDGKYATFQGTSSKLDALANSDIGCMEFMGFVTSGAIASDNASTIAGTNYWCCSGLNNGASLVSGGTHTIYLHVGNKDFVNQVIDDTVEYGGFETDAGASNYNRYSISLRRINIYDVFDGASKVWSSSPEAEVEDWDMDMVDAMNPSTETWSNDWCFTKGGQMLLDLSGSTWKGTPMYPLKIVVSGGHFGTSSGATGVPGPEVWNILPFNSSSSQVVKEVDDHAYGLNALPITSDISVTRAGAYYQAITHKGKVYISRTGDLIQTVSFESVAMGNEKASQISAGAAFPTGAPSTLYGQLRLMRKAQAHNVRVYWDEPQKDGTYVRYWGIITTVSESHGTGSPTSIVNYSLEMVVEEIALIDENGKLMTDLYPLGGVVDGTNFS